ncbi:hypothetical protein GJ744_004446 [Endocarpon pusillum]|uniref:DUF6594 domain-containing protein n=1 Tax=Endocarpon pusillum TaxID=364733 RepID=A0A8H7EBV2_9EURO|nr:hypothetical protein GJ744_004446 [Endocarpon pusillum]
MATSFDEKHGAEIEGTPVTGREPPTPVPGINRTWSTGSYPRLSEFMGLWPEVAIFRRFGALNTQNLLFLQAEIAHLERELQVIRETEEKREDERGLLAQRSWFELSQATEDGEYCPQWAVIQDIRSKLSEYNAFLLQYKEICALHGPSKHDVNCLREWLIRPECGDNFLQGVERDILHPRDERYLENQRASDLVTLSREAVERDFFSQWISDEVLGKFHRWIGRRFKKPFDPESGLYHYRKGNVRAVSHLVGILLASLIPAASIFTLYFVPHMTDRLGVIVAYTALFSICLGVFTTARRVEIFAATAAFASVQKGINGDAIYD